MAKGIRQAKRNVFQRFFLDPLVALGAFVLWVIFKIMPARTASNAGAVLGRGLGALSRRRSQIGLRNLEIAFPEKTDAERRQILKNMWAHWGRFYAEMPHAKKFLKKAKRTGFENLSKIEKAGKGGLFVSGHIGNWELATSASIEQGVVLNPVYRPANNPWLDKLMFQRRKGQLIPKGSQGARKMIELVRKGELIVILADQKLREGIPVPFFGKEAMTAPAIATLALKYDVPILMGRSIRQPDGNFTLTLDEPLDISKEKTAKNPEYAVMLKINQILEEWIRATPEQWLWVHRRFDKSEYK